MTTSLWTASMGRELDTTPLTDAPTRKRVIACLNVWNDLVSLKHTINSWLPFVTAVIAVDGAYDGTDGGVSTDGTREFLRAHPQITVIDGPGLSQCEKRSLYFRGCGEGDYCFIVDADELVTDATQLHQIPDCDVGWVRLKSSLYSREYGQPRIVRWMPGLHYTGRHHWLFQGNQLVCTHQYGGPGYAHRPVAMTIENKRHIGRSGERAEAKRSHQIAQYTNEKTRCAMSASIMSDQATVARESLQICQIAYRDDGIAPSRLHTAINRTTPHASIFFKARPGPFGVATQYSATDHPLKLNQAMAEGDVIHYHGVMSRGPANKPTVFHHHGSLFRTNHEAYMREAIQRNALVLLSNLELFSWVGDYTRAKFLPNTIPVARYARLRSQNQRPFDGSQPFRVAHSPSKPERKGTDVFLAACARLSARGISIEPVMIHDRLHRDSLELKSTCHASFDSFWLGLQCSGLEAAAMGLPVIAGDETVASRYREQFGDVPYTYANSAEELELQLERLACDTVYRLSEADRVNRYVLAYHDESAVALRYLDYLDEAFQWRSTLAHLSRAVRRQRNPVRR